VSYNITSTDTRTSTLRISRKNARKAQKIELPEGMADVVDRLKFGPDGYAPIERFWWYGESSGNAHGDGRLDAFVALTEGDADVILTWEGGDSHSGLRIRNGKAYPCDVRIELASDPETP
jgi:hypothetical protein